MQTVKVTNGTEKQNEFASSIGQKWMNNLESVLLSTKARNDPALKKYEDQLDIAFEKMKDGLSKAPAAHLIAMHQRGDDLAEALISQAKKAAS